MTAAARRASPRLALRIAGRYLSARQGYATAINWVSFLGLALGVMVLTVVLCVLNGFERQIAGRLLDAVPHAVVTGPASAAQLRRILGGGAERAGVSRYFEGEAMLARGGTVDFLALAGLDMAGAAQLPRLFPATVRERLFAASGGIVLGEPLAAARGLAVGDPVVLVVVAPGSAGARPRLERFRLAGTLAGDAAPDVGLAVVRHADVASRGLLAAGVDGWRLHFAAPRALPRLAGRIRTALAEAGAEVRFWMDDYGALFRAIKIEKAIMFALLGLIVAIASFNIVSGQAMLVNHKRGEVAILATLGAPRWLLVSVFAAQGFAVAVAGVAVGLVAGLLLAANAGPLLATVESWLGASLMPGGGAQLPSVVLARDLVAVAALALGLAALAVVWPALKVARENPADVLHAA